MEARLQHLRLTPASSSSSSSGRSVGRTAAVAAANPNSVIRRVAVAANSDRTYINVQPAAVASRHGAVIRNPRSSQWPVNKMVATATAAATSERSSPSSGSGPTTPVIPQSQEVKQFIKEPSYSTLLHIQLQRDVNAAAAAAAAASSGGAPSTTSGPIYANYSTLSSNYSEMEGLRSSDSQGSTEEELLGLAQSGATAAVVHYNSPPSPVSSSYSELRQATKYPPGYHLQQYLQQQQQAGAGAATYEPLYEPIQNPQQPAAGTGANYFYDPIKQQLYLSSRNSRKAYQLKSNESSESRDVFGDCSKCRNRIVGEGSGCEAMGRLYHVACFACTHCHCLLQGKPFYALDGKPYCKSDYLDTLEKCCKCLGPITERILRATGKPYHPLCFTCHVCSKSLDGVPFTVDAANQIHCIEDFHRRFAPKCSVCGHPIMPETGQEETVRVVALDRSFHVNCYRCEDCGLLLSGDEQGRGCYPLDDHVLCKNCNTKRIQDITIGLGVA